MRICITSAFNTLWLARCSTFARSGPREPGVGRNQAQRAQKKITVQREKASQAGPVQQFAPTQRMFVGMPRRIARQRQP